MILFTILAFIAFVLALLIGGSGLVALLILLFTAIVAIAVGGAFLAVFSDVIICAVLIMLLVKLFRRKK